MVNGSKTMAEEDIKFGDTLKFSQRPADWKHRTVAIKFKVQDVRVGRSISSKSPLSVITWLMEIRDLWLPHSFYQISARSLFGEKRDSVKASKPKVVENLQWMAETYCKDGENVEVCN